MYQGAAGMSANARWQEIIAQNMASSSVPGYKKQDVSFAAVQAGVLAPGAVGSTGQARPVALTTAKSHLNFEPGPMRRTDVPTDLAIEGQGLFEVQLPNGNSAYTRDGEFKVNAQGQLVSKQGYPVMGEGGLIQMDPRSSAAITVGPDGTISQGTEVRGQLSLVEFNDPKLLTAIGGGYFLAQDMHLQRQPDSSSSVRQGFLEGANTSPVLEMANLISVMRAFEANQKVVQTQDERMGRVISELGNPN